MKRLSGRWSAPPALAFSLAMGCLLALFASCPLAAGEETEAAREAGKSSGDLIVERFGTPEKLRERIAAPLTSDGTPMKTVEGSSSFNARLFFPSSRRFLEIFVQPSGTGDLGTVLLGQDLDLDGEIDSSFQLPFPVSGVCANGLIACSPGTWRDCRFYLWEADPGGRLSVRPGSLFDLGGCYCINNDCGNNLVWQNLPVVLRDLGGGAVGAVQKARPGFSVSRVETGTSTIAYYGQDTSRVTDPAGGTTSAPLPPTQAAYYSNPFTLSGDTSAAVAGESGDPASLYSRLSALSDATSAGGRETPCSITRVIQVTAATGFCQDPLQGQILSEIRERRFFKVRVAGSTYELRRAMPSDTVIEGILAGNLPYGTVSLKDFACNLEAAESAFDSRTPVPPGVRDGSSGPVTVSPSPPTGGVFLGRTIDYAYYDNDDGGCSRDDIGFYVYEWYEVCTRTADVAAESVENGCLGLESDPDCTLKGEKVDGVWTYRTFNPTGLAPLPSTRTFPGLVSHEFRRDWWRKERTYLCAGTSALEFLEPLKKRYGTVAQSVTTSGADLYYQDLRSVDGTWLAESGTLTVPEGEAVPTCEAACKTRKPKRDTQATVVGHAAAARTDPASWDFFYRRCREDVCPAEDGEEIVRECQCLNDFPEAATIMQVLRQVGKDTLCSDGVPKTPATR